jgi:RNA polymerase sigma-70 factor (ECF subfamily)
VSDRADNAVSAEELLEHAEWIRRLALALVGDANDASDLTQEAFEVALTRPPKMPGPLRPWLGGVVRNLARKRRRSAERRREREQKVALAGLEGVPTPDQLVDRARAQQRVVRSVLELAEPYRSTILLRYYEGLSSAEIARRQSMPAATVRSRLKTGLDRLRAELDSGDRLGGRERWRSLLAPLAAADPNAVTTSASLVKGALAVKTSTKIAAVVIALLVVGYVGGRLAGWWGSSDSSSSVGAGVAVKGDAARAPALGRPALARPGDVNAAISVDDPIGDLRLEGQVIDDQERPVAGATVAIDSHPTRTVTTEDDGSFAFDKLIGRDYQIEAASQDAYAGPVSLRLGAETEPVILRVRAVAPIEIAVVDRHRGREGGKPIAGAEVELRSRLVWTATTGGDGVVSFGGVGARDLTIRINAEGYAPVADRLISFGRREQRIVIAMRAGAAVSGRITDTAGEPIAGARVIADSTSEPFPVIDPRRDGQVSSDDGTFRIPALAAGTYRLTASAAGHATASSSPIVIDGSTERRDIEIALPAGARVRGSVTSATGEQVVGADIRVVATGSVSWRRARRAYTGPDGTFEIRDLSRRGFDVVASHDLGSSEITRIDLTDRTEASVELTLSITGAISGRVVDDTGEPLGEARVRAEPVWSGGLEDRAEWGVRGALFRIADSGGNFSFRGMPSGRYRLRAIRAGDHEAGLFDHQGMVVESGATGVQLVVPASGRVAGRVLYADGEAPELFAVAVGAGDPIPMVSDDGRFELESPGGTIRVEVSGPTFAPKSVAATVEGGETADVGTITVERGRSVSGRVLDPGGAPVAGAEVAVGTLLSGDGSKLFIATESIGAKSAVTDEDGRFVFGGLGPGTLTIVAGKSGVGRSSSVALPRGSDSVSVDLVLASTGKLTGVVRASGKPVGETVIIVTPLGATESNYFVITGADGSFALDALTVGQYLVFPLIGAGGGHRGVIARPNDKYMRPVEIARGETTRADIDFELGAIELEVEVKTDDGTQVAAAAVFVIGTAIDVPNARALRDGGWVVRWLRDNPGVTEPVPQHTRQAVGGKTTIARMTPHTYSACVVPLPGSLDDTAAMLTIPEQNEELPMRCQKVEIEASPTRQALQVVVPGEWARPPKENK